MFYCDFSRVYNINMTKRSHRQSKGKVSEGTVHEMPDDLKKTLTSSKKVTELWEDITPLARNEFICWVEDAKKDETRKRRIRRTKEELLDGERRPCCWMGCVHRKDKKISPSVKAILKKQGKRD